MGSHQHGGQWHSHLDGDQRHDHDDFPDNPGYRLDRIRGALTIHHRELYANSTSFHQGIDQLANWLTVWIPAMATAAQEADAEIQRRMDALQQMDRLR